MNPMVEIIQNLFESAYLVVFRLANTVKVCEGSPISDDRGKLSFSFFGIILPCF